MHLKYFNKLKYKEGEMSQDLTDLFFIEINNNLPQASDRMHKLKC